MVATVRDEIEATFRLPRAEEPHEFDGGRGHIRKECLLIRHRRTVLPATIQGVKDRQSPTRWNNVPPALADLLATPGRGAGDHALMREILEECGQQMRIPVR
jgi:hypothetical protein